MIPIRLDIYVVGRDMFGSLELDAAIFASLAPGVEVDIRTEGRRLVGVVTRKRAEIAGEDGCAAFGRVVIWVQPSREGR